MTMPEQPADPALADPSATQPPEAPPEAAAPAPEPVPAETVQPPPEPVPVADQLAAGVPSEETVTLADQRAGVADAPVVVTEGGDLLPAAAVTPAAAEPAAGLQHPGVSNASPVLPASAAAAAARAHHALGGMIALAAEIRADIERYVPPEMLQAAADTGGALLKAALL